MCFRPDLRERPVVVLSNNDGCIIAASKEVKQLGVRVGAPYFQCRKTLQATGAAVFSANFPLYADMSARLMACLRRHARQVEVYSIDEAFFVGDPQELRTLHDLIGRWVGLPVCVVAAPTKTLAKLASFTAKRAGADTLALLDRTVIEQAMAACATRDIWGIGGNSARRLLRHKVSTALDFCRLELGWVKLHMGMNGLHTWHELNSRPCLGPHERAERRTLIHSRTFPQRITDQAELLAMVRIFAARVAERLRLKRLLARQVHVLLKTARHGGAYHSQSVAGDLVATSDSWQIMGLAERLARRLYRPRLSYVRAEVALVLTATQQQELPWLGLRPSREALMSQIDLLNTRYGRNTVTFGTRRYRPAQQRLSPQYTTRRADICPVS